MGGVKKGQEHNIIEKKEEDLRSFSAFRWPQNADLLENIISHHRGQYEISRDLQEKLENLGIYRDIIEHRIDTGLEDIAKMPDSTVKDVAKMECITNIMDLKLQERAKITDTMLKGIADEEDIAKITDTRLEDIAKITGQNMIIKNWMRKKQKSAKKKTNMCMKKHKDISTTNILSQITDISWRNQDKTNSIIQSR